jgi:hypothetical protein
MQKSKPHINQKLCLYKVKLSILYKKKNSAYFPDIIIIKSHIVYVTFHKAYSYLLLKYRRGTTNNCNVKQSIFANSLTS